MEDLKNKLRIKLQEATLSGFEHPKHLKYKPKVLPLSHRRM